MPYIKENSRYDVFDRGPINAGELNFCITSLIRDYWAKPASGYQSINDILGALEGAKMEFYRRIVVPFEEQKIKENGDVFK